MRLRRPLFYRVQKDTGLSAGALENSEYKDSIVLFNGTNNDSQAKEIYKDWLAKHKKVVTRSLALKPQIPVRRWWSTLKKRKNHDRY